MKLSNLLFLFAFAVSISFTACGDDQVGNCDGFDFQTELSAELQATSNAAIEWVNDPTQENCDALKDAWQDYLDEYKKLENCAEDAGQQAEFNQGLQEAEAAIDQAC